jgi:hypothetical protein
MTNVTPRRKKEMKSKKARNNEGRVPDPTEEYSMKCTIENTYIESMTKTDKNQRRNKEDEPQNAVSEHPFIT